MEPAESHAELMAPVAGGGVSGDLARLRLDDGTVVVAKRPAANGVVRERQRALGMYEREARFYRELAARVPLRTPRCLLATDDLLLLEDLTPAVAGTFAEGLTVAQVDAVIDALTRLHGEWQGSAELHDLPWLWRVERAEADRWQSSLEDRLPRFLDRHREALTERDVRAAELVTANLAALMLAASALPSTLCHGDPGPPNLMFGHLSGEPVFIDWQLAAARHGALDVAWLLVLGVPTTTYRGKADAWLDVYRSTLGLDRDELRRAYGLGVALAVRAPIWMGGAPDSERTPHVDSYAAATISRAFGAMRNHDLTTLL